MTTANPLGTETFRTYAYDDFGGGRWYWRDEYEGQTPLYGLKVRPWIPHDGGPCPVAPHVRVRVKFRDGSGPFMALAGVVRWERDECLRDYDTIAYQIIED